MEFCRNSLIAFWRRSRVWFVFFLLLLLPMAVYWQTIWACYGMRDDYSVMREAREEPGKNIQFCGSQGRPLEGWLFERMFAHSTEISDLSWARLTGALLLGLTAVTVTTGLIRTGGWSFGGAASVGALLTLTPTAQVMVGWSILWAYAVAALCATLAFVMVDRVFVTHLRLHWPSTLCAVSALLLLVVSALIYQPNTLCYLIPFAGGLLAHVDWSWRETRTWMLRHMFMLGAALALAYVLIQILFAIGALHPSPRIAFESDLLGKLLWFARYVVPNALALFVIRDDLGRTTPYFVLAAVIVVALLLASAVLVWHRRGAAAVLRSYGIFPALLVLGYVVNLIAAERWSTYRTIYAITGVVLVFAVFSAGELLRWAVLSQWPRYTCRIVCIAMAAVLAGHQVYELIAVPQSIELARVAEECAKISPNIKSAYVITPMPDQAQAPLVFADEFGSLSTDSTWVPKEIMEYILCRRFPNVKHFSFLECIHCGWYPPPPGRYDTIIDLRLPRWQRSNARRVGHPHK